VEDVETFHSSGSRFFPLGNPFAMKLASFEDSTGTSMRRKRKMCLGRCLVPSNHISCNERIERVLKRHKHVLQGLSSRITSTPRFSLKIPLASYKSSSQLSNPQLGAATSSAAFEPNTSGAKLSSFQADVCGGSPA